LVNQYRVTSKTRMNICSSVFYFSAFCVESKVWQKVKVEGDTLIGRGAHTLVAVDGRIVLYGGSAEFRRNLGHCTRYFNDIYIMKTGKLILSVRFLTACNNSLMYIYIVMY